MAFTEIVVAMRNVVSMLIFLHGGIHLLGFLNAFRFTDFSQLPTGTSPPIAWLWLLAAVLLILSALARLKGFKVWPILLNCAVAASQLLLLVCWTEAKFGTLPNSILLLVGVAALGTQRFENSYYHGVKKAFTQHQQEIRLITEKDLAALPEPVQQYLRNVGVLGKPRINNMRVVFEGEMREKGKAWFPFRSEQFNFFSEPGRFFFMKARMKGIPVSGFHEYVGDKASMLIKLAGWIPLVRLQDGALFPTETVTYFNDLCLFAPAALIDERIEWEAIDGHTARALFRNKGATIHADLTFNQEGQLIHFVSPDRVEVNENRKIPFSTPVGEYKMYSGFKLPGYGEGVWNYPEGDFTYGKFTVISVEYNLSGIP